MEIVDIFRKFCKVRLKNMHPLDLVCTNFLSEEAPLKVRDLHFKVNVKNIFFQHFQNCP